MKKRVLILMLFMISLMSSCVRTESEVLVDDGNFSYEEALLQREGPRVFDVMPGAHGYLAVQWLEHMNDDLPNRLAFSDCELATAEWIAETLIKMGFDEEQVEIQPFAYEAPTTSWWDDATMMIEWHEAMGYYDGLERLDESQNVILTLPGKSAETIIIGAHYDSVGYPGISDNASGTVLLLENAYLMRDVDHYYTLQYVFFGAEEVGLIGAFYFVYHMTQEDIDNLVLMINADVILDGPELIYAVAYMEQLPASPMDLLWESPTYSQNALTAQIEELANWLNAEYQTELISRPHAIVVPTDQLAFLQLGIPVMVFYATHPVQYPNVFSGDVLHTADDDLDVIMSRFPGRIERSLSSFGRFLEEVVRSEFVE